MCEALEKQFADGYADGYIKGEASGIRNTFEIALEFMSKEEAIRKTAEKFKASVKDVKKILRRKPSLI